MALLFLVILNQGLSIFENEKLKKTIEIRQQYNNANIFEGIISHKEYFDFTMCNPPFHSSKEDASKGTLKKLRNLEKDNQPYQTKKDIILNFGGQANELWCNGGEALFIKRMIKQSIVYKKFNLLSCVKFQFSFLSFFKVEMINSKKLIIT